MTPVPHKHTLVHTKMFIVRNKDVALTPAHFLTYPNVTSTISYYTRLQTQQVFQESMTFVTDCKAMDVFDLTPLSVIAHLCC